MTPPRVVLDTNVVVSALVFSHGHLTWLRAAWQSGRVRPLVSRSVVRELIRVLEYPKFGLDVEEREILLGDYLPMCEVIRVSARVRAVPECRDAHDRKFLELATAGKADFLVTGDVDLLSLASMFTIPIVNPADFRARVELSLSERAAQSYVPAAVAARKPRKLSQARARSGR